MKSYIELNDADYKFILAKGGRIERILLNFSKDDIADVVFKPIMNDLKVETFKCDMIISGLPENCK